SRPPSVGNTGDGGARSRRLDPGPVAAHADHPADRLRLARDRGGGAAPRGRRVSPQAEAALRSRTDRLGPDGRGVTGFEPQRKRVRDTMPRKKILLVDDSNTVLIMERMILNKGSYDLVTAKDGSEAVERAFAERPDLILLDVIMPRMNGFEVCRKIREDEGMKGVPIIMVTTRGEGENVENGFQSGCSDYITKPFSSLELLTKVQRYLR